MSNKSQGLSYKDAGVDIEAGDQLVERIKSVAKSTKRPEVLGGLGGFGALCKIPAGYKQPVLVSGTDGVGTKLKLALELNQHDSIGQDLVGMCVNDLIVTGAEPLFFLDYYATGHLDIETAATVVAGIGQGCKLAGCALVGGETAEMPGMYHNNDYDLAGFAVGVVEQDEIIDGSKVANGNALIAIGSSGAHSNGYSLIRKIIEVNEIDLSQHIDGKKLADLLLTPTRIYVKSLLALAKKIDIHAMAHITGGGLPGNLPRVLPDGLRADINSDSWQWPALFQFLQQQGQVDTFEMYRTFNCGIGMVLVIDNAMVEDCIQQLTALGENAWLLGRIESDANSVKGADEKDRVIFN